MIKMPGKKHGKKKKKEGRGLLVTRLLWSRAVETDQFTE